MKMIIERLFFYSNDRVGSSLNYVDYKFEHIIQS